MCTVCVPDACGGQSKVLGPLEQKLQMVVNCLVGVGSKPHLASEPSLQPRLTLYRPGCCCFPFCPLFHCLVLILF